MSLASLHTFEAFRKARLGKDAEFEAKHPRDKGGKFAESGGGADAGKDANVPAKRQWVDHAPGLPLDTMEHWTKPDGSWDPERAKLHQQIISESLDHVKAPEAGAQPQAVVMMGGTASGKSTFAKAFDDGTLVRVDADAVKKRLPEFGQALAASAKDAAYMVHEESSYLAKRIRDLAMEQGKNILFDGTGANAKNYSDMIERLQAKGYKVTLVMSDIPVEMAVQRAAGRAERSGRMVPEDVIRKIYDSLRPNFVKLAAKADSFQLWDNSEKTPRMIWQKNNGIEQVHDRVFVERIKQR